jgi:hypothetical protein
LRHRPSLQTSSVQGSPSSHASGASSLQAKGGAVVVVVDDVTVTVEVLELELVTLEEVLLDVDDDVVLVEVMLVLDVVAVVLVAVLPGVVELVVVVGLVVLETLDVEELVELDDVVLLDVVDEEVVDDVEVLVDEVVVVTAAPHGKLAMWTGVVPGRMLPVPYTTGAWPAYWIVFVPPSTAPAIVMVAFAWSRLRAFGPVAVTREPANRVRAQAPSEI